MTLGADGALFPGRAPLLRHDVICLGGRGKGLVMEQKLELSESFTLNSITSLAVLL